MTTVMGVFPKSIQLSPHSSVVCSKEPQGAGHRVGPFREGLF